MPTDQEPRPEGAPERFAEAVIFRWYTLCAEEHDQLSLRGLDALEEAIAQVFAEEAPHV